MGDTTVAKSLNLWRGGLLSVQVVITLYVALKAIVLQPEPLPPIPAATLGGINFAGWQKAHREPLTDADIETVLSGQFQQGNRQYFQQRQQSLTVTQAYVAHTDGDLKNFIKDHSSDLNQTLNFDPNLGYYSRFFQGNTLTITACLSSNQRMTVTADQFKVQQLNATFSLKRIGGWLLNHHSLIPQTCLWRSLSLHPVDHQSVDSLTQLWTQFNSRPIP